MIIKKPDGTELTAVVSDEVNGQDTVWFAAWDVSRLLGKRIIKSDLVRSGMVAGRDFAVVQITDEVYFDLRTPEERKKMREARKKARAMEEIEKNASLVPNLGTGDSYLRVVERYFHGQQKRLLISETGLYRLVFTSRGPFADGLKDWLADEVIPAIRKHGTYTIPDDHPIWEVFTEMESQLKMLNGAIANAADRLTVADIINTAPWKETA